jgi:hypothetical protein
MRKVSIKNYYKPTKLIWRKIGDSLLIAATSLSAFVMNTPLPEKTKLWLVFSINFVGVIGKVISNLFKQDN